MTSNNRRKDAAAAAILFLGFFALYLATAAQGIMFEDSGEFAMSTASLGVSHPPGYPLYNLVGRLLQFLPAGDAGFRANILSAFLGAVGLAVLFAAARTFGFSVFGALLGVAACGVSRTLWSQAIVPEVYSLNLLLNALLLLALAKAWAGERRSPIALAALLCLAATNHYITLAAFLPVVLVVVFSKARWREVPARLSAAIAVALSLTLVYAELPLRAAANPVFNWRSPDTVAAFIRHIERTQFSAWESQLQFHLPTVMKYFSGFINNLPHEFSGVFLFLSVLGLALLLTERFKVAAGLAWLFLVQSLAILIFIRFHADDAGFSIVRVFYIGAYMIMALFIASAADGLIKRIGEGPAFLRVPVAAVLALCLFFPLSAHLKANNLSGDARYAHFRKDIFRFLPRDAIYYANGSQFMSPAMYEQATGLRPDVTLVESSGNLLQDRITRKYGQVSWINMDLTVTRMVSHFANTHRQVFDYPRKSENGDSITRQVGPLFQYSEKPGCDLRGWSPKVYGFTPESVADRDFETRLLASILDARMAECNFTKGRNADGMEDLRRAVADFDSSSHVRLFAGQLLDRYGFSNEAVNYYNEALDRTPTYTDALAQIGNILLEQGETTSAKVYYKRALEIAPDHAQSLVAMANIAQMERDFNTAERIYRDQLALYPDSVLIMNNLANVEFQLRRITEAKSLFLRALEIEPESELTVMNYTGFLLDMGDYPAAFDMLEKYLKEHPKSSYVRYNLAVARQRMGNMEGALEEYRRTVKDNPEMTRAWINLVMLLLEANRVDDARKEVLNMRYAVSKKLQPTAAKLYFTAEKKATVINPLDGKAWSNMVYGLMQLQQYKGARAMVEEMLKTGGPKLKPLASKLTAEIDAIDPAAKKRGTP